MAVFLCIWILDEKKNVTFSYPYWLRTVNQVLWKLCRISKCDLRWNVCFALYSQCGHLKLASFPHSSLLCLWSEPFVLYILPQSVQGKWKAELSSAKDEWIQKLPGKMFVKKWVNLQNIFSLITYCIDGVFYININKYGHTFYNVLTRTTVFHQ